MPMYMTQPMSGEKTETITYYRRQSQPHVSHEESGLFTNDAKTDYAKFNHMSEDNVIIGGYRSGQGVPVGGKTHEI